MNRSAFVMGVVVAMGFALPAQAQWFPHATRTKKVCCISGRYDYSSNKLTSPVTSVTFPGVIDTDSATSNSVRSEHGTRTKIRIKSFPLRARVLASDHCRASRVVMTVAENGMWTVDMLAEQNAMLVDEQVRPKFQLYDQNRFHVTLRPLLGDVIVTPDTLNRVDAASVTSIRVAPFWLERGQSKQVHEEGYDARLEDRFDSIKVVAIDLQYE